MIAPTDRAPWTDDIYAASKRLAGLARASLVKKDVPVANYIAGGDGLDFRSDLGTLNLSNVPTVMVELGNMKNAADAAAHDDAEGPGGVRGGAGSGGPAVPALTTPAASSRHSCAARA